MGKKEPPNSWRKIMRVAEIHLLPVSPRYASAAFRHFLQRSDRQTYNRVSRSKHSITHPDILKRPRFTAARGRSKVTALLLSSRLGLMRWQALRGRGRRSKEPRVNPQRQNSRSHIKTPNILYTIYIFKRKLNRPDVFK